MRPKRAQAYVYPLPDQADRFATAARKSLTPGCRYVLGSHYSGREPPTEEPPVPADDERLNFDGRPPHTAVCKAGSIYLHHPQTWHRGTQNVSGKRRYLHQQQYGQAWFFGRFFTAAHQPGYDTAPDFAESTCTLK